MEVPATSQLSHRKPSATAATLQETKSVRRDQAEDV